MSHWPEPAPDPAEPPRWPVTVALIAAVSAVGVLAANGAGLLNSSWRGPDFEFPEINLPEIRLPDMGGSQQAEPPAENIASVDELAPTEANSPIVQTVSFEGCLAAVANTANGLNQEPILIEDTSDRRVAVFKMLDGDLTVICSRPDGTMTSLQRGG